MTSTLGPHDAPPAPDLTAPRTRAELSDAAVRAIRRLAQCWALTDRELTQLTGGVHAQDHPRQGSTAVEEDETLSTDQLTRISALLGIYTALSALHSGPLANGWVRRPNTNELFAGRTPLQVMINGGVAALLEVRTLLEGRVAH